MTLSGWSAGRTTPVMLTDLLLRVFLTIVPIGAVTGANPAHEAQPVEKPTPVVVAPAPAPAAPVVERIVERVDAPRVAQVRLVETLSTAEAIHSISAKGNKITFTITRDGLAVAVIATTRRGEVIALAMEPAAPNAELGGGLSWLADELESITAITRLVADEDGAVTITTNDGRRYMAIPGRGSGGNAAAAAHWAGEWDHT